MSSLKMLSFTLCTGLIPCFIQTLVATETPTAGSLATALSSLASAVGDSTVDQGVKTRLTTVSTILDDSSLQSHFLTYKILRMNELIGEVPQEEETLQVTSTTPLAALIKSEIWGTPGDPISLVTSYGRLNALLDIIAQDTLLDRIGECTDTALRNGRTLWSQLKWVMDLFDLSSQVSTFEALVRSWCQYPLFQLTQGDDSTNSENITPLLNWASGSSEDYTEAKTKFDSVKDSLTDQDTTENIAKILSAFDWAQSLVNPLATEEEPPALEEEQVAPGAKAGEQSAEGQSSVGDLAGQEVTNPVVQGEGTEKEEEEEEEEDENSTAVIPTIDDLAEICGETSDLVTTFSIIEKLNTSATDLRTITDALGTSDDSFSRQPFTVCSLLHKLQRDLRGCVSLLNKNRFTELLSKYGEVTSAMTSLQTEALTYLNGTSESSPQEPSTSNFTTKLEAMITVLKGYVTSDITTLTPSVPGFTLLEPEDNVKNIMNRLTTEVDLDRVVLVATHTWPLIAARVNSLGSDDATEKAVYMGQFVQPGLTLTNCLLNLARFVFVDPILDRIGRQGTQSHASTLLGALTQKQPTIMDNSTDVSEHVTNTLLLLVHLLERSPGVAFEKGDGSTAFYSSLDSAIGKTDTPDSCLGIVKAISDENNCDALVAKIKGIKTSLRTALKLSTEDFTWPETFDALDYWVEADNVLAALRNGDTEDTELLQKELFSRPLVYKLTGLPSVTDTHSWRAQVEALDEASTKGSTDDPWFSVSAQSLHSLINYAVHLIEQGYDLLAGSQSGNMNGLFGKLTSCLQDGLTTNSDKAGLYSDLVEPYQDIMETILKKEASEATYSGSLVTNLPADSALLTSLKIGADSLATCYSSSYPVNLTKILRHLQVISTTISSTMDATALAALTNLGKEDDHPADVTLFGHANGILFECGAQLLLNFIGKPTDPGLTSTGTLYAAVRKAEVEAKQKDDTKGYISTNLTSIRNSLARLKGNISYYYMRLLAGSDLFTSTLSSLQSSSLLTLTTDILNKDYSKKPTTSPWANLDKLTDAIAKATGD